VARPPQKARRAAVALVGLLLSCLGVAMMAANADAEDASMTITRANGAVLATNGSVVVGEKLTIHLSGFAPTTTVVIDVGPTQLAPSPKTDAKGAALVPFSFPKLALAPYVISATAGGMTTTTVVTVVTAPASTPAPTASHSASPSASVSASHSTSASPASTGSPTSTTSSVATTPSPALTSPGPSTSATALAKTGPATSSLSLSGAALLAVGVVLVVVGGAGGSPAARHVRVAGAHVRRH